MVAANNVANALLMVAAAAMVAGLAAADIPSPRVLEGAAVANFLVALVIARVLLRIARSRAPGAKLEVPSG
jgi:hypothetical protein